MDIKRTSGEIWIHGIELMIVAIFTIYLIYLYSIFYWTYGNIVLSVGGVFIIYFAVKFLILKRKIKKDYVKSLTDIGEIVKK